MNVPFPPLWLLPVPVFLLIFGVWTLRRSSALRRRLQSAPATNEGTPARERMAVEREFIRSRWIGVNCLIFGTLALYELVFFTAPPVYGQLLELQTGKPIAGARVTRHLSQVGPWRIFEGPAAAPVVFSTHEVHSDSQGRFALPGWINLVPLGVQGLSGMSWVVFASGWMPAYGCVGRGFHPLGAGWIDCGAFGSPSTVDPWVQATVGGFVGFTTMRIRISRPTVEGVMFGGRDSNGRFIPAPGPRKGIDDDPWGEYFRRLNLLVQYRYVTIEEFVDEARRYADSHELTTWIYDEMYQVQQSLGGLEEGGKYNQPQQALVLLSIQEKYCQHHSGERRCSSEYFEHRRSFLQQGLLSNQKSTQ